MGVALHETKIAGFVGTLLGAHDRIEVVRVEVWNQAEQLPEGIRLVGGITLGGGSLDG